MTAMDERHAGAARVAAELFAARRGTDDELAARLAGYDRDTLVDGLCYLGGQLEAALRERARRDGMDPDRFVDGFAAELAERAAQLTARVAP